MNLYAVRASSTGGRNDQTSLFNAGLIVWAVNRVNTAVQWPPIQPAHVFVISLPLRRDWGPVVAI